MSDSATSRMPKHSEPSPPVSGATGTSSIRIMCCQAGIQRGGEASRRVAVGSSDGAICCFSNRVVLKVANGGPFVFGYSVFRFCLQICGAGGYLDVVGVAKLPGVGGL